MPQENERSLVSFLKVPPHPVILSFHTHEYIFILNKGKRINSDHKYITTTISWWDANNYRKFRSGRLEHFSPKSTWFHMNFNNIIVFHSKASRGFRWTDFITVKWQYNLFQITLPFICICFNNPFKLVILQRIEKGE